MKHLKKSSVKIECSVIRKSYFKIIKQLREYPKFLTYFLVIVELFVDKKKIKLINVP